MGAFGDAGMTIAGYAKNMIERRIKAFQGWAEEIKTDAKTGNYLSVAKDIGFLALDTTLVGGEIYEAHEEYVAPTQDKNQTAEEKSVDTWRETVDNTITTDVAAGDSPSMSRAFESYAEYSLLMKGYEESLLSDDKTLVNTAKEQLGSYFEKVLEDGDVMTSPYMISQSELMKAATEKYIDAKSLTGEEKTAAMAEAKNQAIEAMTTQSTETKTTADMYAAIYEKYKGAASGTILAQKELAEQHFGKSYGTNLETSTESHTDRTNSAEGIVSEENESVSDEIETP